MEAAEETLTYRDDTGLHRKLLPQDTDKESKVHGTERKGDESNYVDLDMKPDSAKTVKVSFTSNGNQLSVIKGDSSKQREHEKETKIISDGFVKEQSEDERATVSGEPPLETPAKLPNTDQGSETDKQRQAEPDPSDCSEVDYSDELQYTDMYLNSKTESDDGVSAVLSDHCGSDIVEDESHYITTHEIQLTELDHDVDYDLGRGTYWDFEDDNLVYSFVDYASFESDETQEGTMILEGRSQVKVQPGLGGAVVGTEPEESDLCDSDKCASSDESVCKNQSGDTSEGKFQLAIQTSTRAANDPVKTIDDTTRGYTEHFGDRSHFSFVSSGARAGPLCDRAQYFIPAPGRQHLATKLRRKDINEYSSGASSSISELDDADKEVRNLTAKSFRSLACPYFDAINLSTSSESSVSEYGVNKWSAYVDWNYGNMWRGREQSVIAHKTSSATLEMNVSSKRNDKSITAMKAPQSKGHQASRRTTFQQASSSCKKIELRDPVEPKQRGVTLDLRCNVEGPDRTQTCSKSTCNEVTGTVSGWEMQCHHTENTGDTQKRATFASSLLKNVISKKMQFEQERKMERGEICDTHPPLSSCLQIKDQERINQRSLGRGLQQTSEPGCGVAGNADEQRRTSFCESTEEQKNSKDVNITNQHSPLSSGQSVQFSLQKEDDPEPVKEAEPSTVGDTQTTAKEEVDASGLRFVPSCKRADSTEDLRSNTPAPGPRTCETGINTVSKHDKGGKTPEIKICLRNVKENRGSTLNIASLLTPKISFNTVNTFRPADEAKWHILSATDKAPNFTVRDIKDTKCKFQTPIYQVRDVRKLVKSSYRFVSLDNSNSKCSTVAEKMNEKAKKEAVKLLLPSPIVIKCQSVKTNAKPETSEASEKQGEAAVSHSDGTSSRCVASRRSPVTSKQRHPDNLDVQQAPDSKVMKQRQDRFPCEAALPKQAAIEKLKAAVKTMEQLYEFDRNEWKRKTHAPRPAADSRVLPLIAGEKQGAEEPEAADADGSLLDSTGTALSVTHVPRCDKETLRTQRKIFSNQSVVHFGSSNKTHVGISSVSGPASQSSALPPPSAMKSSTTLVAPLSVRIEAPKHNQVEQTSPTPPAATQGCSDYLTIPGLAHTSEVKGQAHAAGEQKGSPLIMEYPAVSVYHQPAARPPTQQMLCFSPSVPTASPVSSTGDTVPQTQRKMLLDPTTGHYYLVDTPIQATTKRLFDPETGQYVDIPMPQSPAAPVTPVTPVPLSLSPLALSPAAYAHTYMLYPGFIPSPTLPAQVVLLSPSEDRAGEKFKNSKSPRLERNTEGDYYSPTGDASQPQPLSTRGGAARTERRPLISITAQQGPRIIAPPSFDGTTMSFVVEHR